MFPINYSLKNEHSSNTKGSPLWKDFSYRVMDDCQEDWQYLNKIAQSRNASFE